MPLTVKQTGKRLASMVLTDAALMRDIGLLFTRQIRTRTERQTSVDGSTFKPLSAGYAKQKQKALGHSRADLTVSGKMLNDMAPTLITRDHVTISFRSQGGGSGRGTFVQRSRSMGAMDKAVYNDPTRHFFDVNEAELAEAQAKVDAYLGRAITLVQV